MAKKTAVTQDEVPSVEDDLRAELARKDEALSQARKGLFRIAGTDPVTFISGPGKPPAIVKAFEKVKQVAETTILNISDAESPLNG